MKTAIYLFIAIITLSSCVSINQAGYTKFSKERYTQGIRADSIYHFRNEPYKSYNMINLTDSVPLENPTYTLWHQLDFNSKLTMDELRDTHVRITTLSPKRLKFDLMTLDGQLIQSRKRRIKRYGDFVELKPKTYLRNRYVVFNAITSTAIAMALTKDGNLLVLEESGGMVFFIVIPFGGTSFGDTYEYRPYLP